MAVYDISSIVMSTRIRLARNLEDFPMPQRLSSSEGFEVLKQVAKAVGNLDEFKIYTINKLPEIDAKVMQEKHLISSDLLEKDYGAVILNNDESISIMVNEEDHIREQCFMRGLELEKAFETLSGYDDKILSNLKVAYDEKFGFLTSCITNVGTGMRASVMMFLPALTITGQIKEILPALSQKGLCARGVYGESSGADGYMFQISNEHTIGQTEKEIVGTVKEAVLRICEFENRARKNLMATQSVKIKDKVFRALAILSNCCLLTAQELLTLAGEVKMGIALGVLRFKDNGIFDKLVVSCQPNNLTQISGRTFFDDEVDEFRAKYVNEALKNQRIK
ncbi:MAG: protein arginine kinase [Clostridia bacterium]|nr:protein arginine kinase [Clostridia bacterium]